MKKKTAYKIAIAAIEKEIRRTTSFEANLYERGISRTHSTLRAYNRRERFRRAIRILNEEGGLMGIADPVLISYQFKRKNFILLRGKETFYDPETREIREFDTVGEARAWSVTNLGVDPVFAEGSKEVEPPLETLPLFTKEKPDEDNAL
jgi:hypothetical protein